MLTSLGWILSKVGPPIYSILSPFGDILIQYCNILAPWDKNMCANLTEPGFLENNEMFKKLKYSLTLI